MDTTRRSAGDILVIDDYPVNLRLLQDILLEEHYEVRAATTGHRALASAFSSPPDLIMLDISMPDMDGYEICRRLKADPSTSDVPIIFISAHDDPVDKVRAFRAGGVDYVTKPFQAEEVLARIENQLKISRLTKELEQSKRELERQNEELRRRNSELLQAQRRTDLVFSALTDSLPGCVLDGKYHLAEQIGAGGFGSVYRGMQLADQRPVAVKVFRPLAGNDTPEALERFQLEGQSASRLAHRNAVSVLDFGMTERGIAYLVMELLDGHTLTEELQQKGLCSPARCGEILVQVCQALAEAHELGIVHRDVKPENIFLHRDGEGEVVKVLDFGTVKLLGEPGGIQARSLTTAGQVIGTPEYMAPERLRDDDYDGRSDVYSVGIMMYRMLCGRVPFSAKDPYVVAVMQLNNAPPPLRQLDPTIPEAVEKIALRALAKERSRRPTAAALAAQLAAACGIG
jgi:CheY-like chemotaxis protein